MKQNEQDKLIATFMGHILTTDETGKEQSRIFVEGLGTKLLQDTYRVSWDWLIPVLKQIRETVNTKLSIDDFECYRAMEFNFDVFDYSIEEIYKEVIKFLEWYEDKNI